MNSLRLMGLGKVASARQALSGIRDGSVIAVSGFNMSTTPELLLEELYRIYKETGHPRYLFLISDTFPGAPGRALDRVFEELYKEGDDEFIEGVLMPYLGWSKWLQKMVLEDRIEAYTWSIGVMAYWFREVGSGRPGVLTRVGLGTFFDPRMDGGYLNERARKSGRARVQLITIDGEEYLLYTAPQPDVALIRGSTADELGNLTMEDEAIYGTVLNIAQATKAYPKKGLVVAQVLRVARYGSLNPKEVAVPGPLVDYVVVASPDKHWQTASINYDPRIAGRIIPPISEDLVGRMQLSIRKVIARRVLLELVKLAVDEGRQIIVNLGVGIPSHVMQVAVEEKVEEVIATTIESGPWGGVPLTGPDFGAAIGPYAIIQMPDQFAIYEGGVIDAASLGFLQIDKEGNVNPSMLPGRLPGPGGFPVIISGAPRIYYAGGFTAGKRDIRIVDGKLYIIKDGDVSKFVERVYKVFCPCKRMVDAGREVLVITERAVFRMESNGLKLEEVAPGVDVERDIIGKMEFKPIIKREPEEMPKEIFRPEPMRLRRLLEEAGKR
ncbi:MAG: acyl CoA:acetate/3-ketoacid CoA transferase [Desulfurococcales archaeon]|nr:acyl CoA:acetate/3-ketoacid CoA transferase [Desulfurococcales archaeon]MCE4605109.1 acyl CoA:acetate/3-ketoacid CoA transferase [Desulfurococcales archaeon]